MSLRPEVARWLEAACPQARATPLAGDASTREFFRIAWADGTTQVLMDYGRPFSGSSDDMLLTGIFRDAGLPVAEILDVRRDEGCLLLEDLGDRTLESVLLGSSATPPKNPQPLLREAVLLAARVAADGTPVLGRSNRAEGPALDAERFRFEMDFFVKHYAGDLLGRRDLPPALDAELGVLADEAARTPQRVLCHRDFHSRNLLVTDAGDLKMVDIQDARWGPDSYDLASLLCDAYAEIAEGWVDPLIDAYLAALPEKPDAALFRARFDLVAAQRMLKALGTFGYQIARCGRERYSDAIPLTLARLQRLLPRLERTRGVHDLLTSADLL